MAIENTPDIISTGNIDDTLNYMSLDRIFNCLQEHNRTIKVTNTDDTSRLQKLRQGVDHAIIVFEFSA